VLLERDRVIWQGRTCVPVVHGGKRFDDAAGKGRGVPHQAVALRRPRNVLFKVKKGLSLVPTINSNKGFWNQLLLLLLVEDRNHFRKKE
jgi:hypothetical protein